MNKSWIKIVKRTSDEFIHGLEEFIEHAKRFVTPSGNIKCPCRKCRNVYEFKPDIVYNHIHDKGFDPTYTTWCFHGEPYPRKRKQVPVRVEPVNEMAHVINDFLGHSDFQDEVTTLDAWKTTKQRSDGSLAHPDYEPIYTQLQQGMEHLTQQYVSQCGDTSDASLPSTPKLTPRDQRSVIETVLKPRRDFTPGIGPKVTRRHSKTTGDGDSATSSSSRPPVSDSQQEEIQRLRQQLGQQQQQLQFQEQQRVASETRMSYIATILRQVPGVNFDNSQLFPPHINLDDEDDGGADLGDN